VYVQSVADNRAAQAIASISSIADGILRNPSKMTGVVIPYSLTFIGFLVFLKWNGGIVLGKPLYSFVYNVAER
jgi:hypothetical protein